jgi:prophage DNA circulation protein
VDYDLQRNEFLSLLIKTGAAWLDHPWLGKMEVCAKDWSISESTDKGGYCAINIDFVPAGMVVTAATTDHIDNATDKTVALSDSAQSAISLSIMSLEMAAGFITEAISLFNGLQNVLSMMSLPMMDLETPHLIQVIKNDFVSLLVTPTDYVFELRTVVDSILVVDSVLLDTDRPCVVANLTSLATRYPLQSSLLKLNVAPSSALELPVNIQKNTALHACFLISVAGQLALTQYRTLDDRDAALASVLTAIEFLLPVLPDEVFQAAVDARVAIYDALMVQDLQPVQHETLFSAMPSTVLAHRFDIDDPLFLVINAVRHPLFIAGDVVG